MSKREAIELSINFPSKISAGWLTFSAAAHNLSMKIFCKSRTVRDAVVRRYNSC